MNPSLYWILSNWGNSDEPQVEGYRCTLEHFSYDPPHLIPQDQYFALRRARPVVNWNPELHIRCDKPGPLEDFPWANQHVASERLKAFFEHKAPRCAQFLPFVLACSDGTPSPYKYYIINWLCVIDCCDPHFSDTTKNADGTLEFDDIVVDASRIPPDATVCRAKGTPHIIIRDDLKQMIEHIGFTGCQFYKVKMLADVLQRPMPPQKIERRPQ